MNRKSTKLLQDFVESLLNATYHGALRWLVSRSTSNYQGDKDKQYIVRSYKLCSSDTEIIIKLKQYSKRVMANQFKLFNTDMTININGDVIELKGTSVQLQDTVMELCTMIDKMYNGYEFNNRTLNTMMNLVNLFGYSIDNTEEYSDDW